AQHETLIVCLSSHRIMSGAERAAYDYRNLRYDRVRDCVHHLRSRFDDATPLRIPSYHEAVYIVKEDQRNQILIAVHDEARRFFRRLRVNHSAELNPLVALVISLLRM